MGTKQYIVTTPDGTEVEAFNLRKFCRENNLNVGAMSSVIAGKHKHHKGFKARHKE